MAPVDAPRSAVLQVLPVEAVRRDFAALARTHKGRPVAYFDGPGGTQVPGTVVTAMVEYLRHHNANTHWAYPSSAETDAIIDAARRDVAMFLNSASDEVAFGQNMTSLTFHLARTLGRRWGPGDTIVVTELDHHANVDSWRAIEIERGVTIDVVPMRVDTGTLDWSALERALARRPRLLAIGAASNALGTINDVAQATRLAHDAGALVFVDAVHYAPHVLVDVRAIGCDFLACSAYKFYGPHLGILFGRRDVLIELDVPKLVPAPNGPAERFETGTQNHEGIAGASAAIRYLASLAAGMEGRPALAAVFAALHERGHALFEQLWTGLAAVPRVRLYGVPPGAPRTPTIAFTVEGRDSESVARALADEALFVSHGDFYATTVVTRLGLAEDGLVRAGCACYTSTEEIDRLVSAVARVASGA
jgi:cysteine desulfurase family protein (TIGR01976 family)